MVKTKRTVLAKKNTPDASQATTAELEAIVFGGASFARGAANVREQPDDAAEEKEGDASVAEKTPAWVDPDDANLDVPLVGGKQRKRLRGDAERHVTGDEYERILRQRFTKLNGVARWTDMKPLSKDLSDSDDEGLEAVASSMPAVSRGGNLKPGRIDMQRMRELPMLATGQSKGSSAIEALQFHPHSELLLTAGRDKTLRIFAVDGEENPKVASYYFKKFPILGATFTPTGDQVLLTSTTSQIWGLDVSSGEPFEVRNITSDRSALRCLAMGPSPTQVSGLKSSQMYGVLGDHGAISICDITTKHTIRTLRMSAPGVALLFAPHQDTIYSADEESNIYEWDIASGRCRQKVKEAWAMKIRCLAASGMTRKLAVGTATGNVDILDLSGPKLSGTPVSSIGNLTTRVDCLRYNPDGQILGACSRMKADSLKLVHAGTATVFQNWPAVKTPLNRASVLDFSKHGLLAIGNEVGRVLLYRLKHYTKSN